MQTLDWNNLGFAYRKTDYRYVSYWRDGAWDQGALTKDGEITISEAATALHYGQQCFEGLKAYRRKDGRVQLFRPQENARRLIKSCERLLAPTVPEEKFLDAVRSVVRANESYVPPYESGGTLYIRPYLVGIDGTVAVAPAQTYLFSVFVFPVGAYFKGGLTPIDVVVSDYDRAAPYGTGGVKVGGNYAASMWPNRLAKEQGFADALYLDPATHTKIEEVGSANFFGITHDGTFVTPRSPSILPSITKYSLMYLAEHILGMNVEERDIPIDTLSEFSEVGACGTAAVITPIGRIVHGDKTYRFGAPGEVGPVTRRLYDLLVGIQYGDIEAPEGWIVEV